METASLASEPGQADGRRLLRGEEEPTREDAESGTRQELGVSGARDSAPTAGQDSPQSAGETNTSLSSLDDRSAKKRTSWKSPKFLRKKSRSEAGAVPESSRPAPAAEVKYSDKPPPAEGEENLYCAVRGGRQELRGYSR